MTTKSINNEEFNEALSIIDNRKIMNTASKRYSREIPKDELDQCKMLALWRSLEIYKPDGGKKFTSILYEAVLLQCKQYLTRQRRQRRLYSLPPDLFYPNKPDYTDLVDSISGLPDDTSTAVRQYFLDGLKLKEIASVNNYCHETARSKIKKGLRQLKKIWLT